MLGQHLIVNSLVVQLKTLRRKIKAVTWEISSFPCGLGFSNPKLKSYKYTSSGKEKENNLQRVYLYCKFAVYLILKLLTECGHSGLLHQRTLAMVLAMVFPSALILALYKWFLSTLRKNI